MGFFAFCIALCSMPRALCLSNHPIRPRQNIRRNREADLLCGFQIDH